MPLERGSNVARRVVVDGIFNIVFLLLMVAVLAAALRLAGQIDADRQGTGGGSSDPWWTVLRRRASALADWLVHPGGHGHHRH
jgi:hypothetical protein